MATKVLFKSGDLNTLNNADQQDGTLYVAKRDDATAELHVDLGSTRYKVTELPATSSADGLMTSSDKTKLDYVNIAWGTCSTAAATAAKVVTLNDNFNWKLAVGSIVVILFSNTNTATNPTLNINGTGAKSIYFQNSLIATTASTLQYAGYKNRPMIFIYDGAYYRFAAWGYDTTYNAAGTSLGLVQSGGDVSIANGVITVNDNSHNHTIANVSGLQSALDAKAASSHAHGNITNAGAIGTTSGKAVITTTNGVLTTGAVPVASGGTGATTAAGALTNLGLTATAAELNKMDGVTATTTEINKLDGLTATTTELNYVDGVTSNIQTQLDGKLSTSGGTVTGALTVSNTNSSASNGLFINRSGSSSEQVRHYVDDNIYHLVYTNDETSNSVKFEMMATDTENSDGTNKSTSVVTLSNSGNKSTVTATTFVGALSGNASSATKLTTSAGSATQPVYFSNGVPVKTTYTLGKSVPSNAKFTDTTYSVATTTASGLMSSADKSKLDGLSSITFSEIDPNVSTVPLNADTLGGHPASDYYTKTEVDEKLADIDVSSQIQESLNGLKFVVLSQDEFDALVTKDSSTIYYIYEEA